MGVGPAGIYGLETRDASYNAQNSFPQPSPPPKKKATNESSAGAG